MSTLTKFVAAVQAADPSLAGSTEIDKSEITRLSSQTESSSDFTDLDKLGTKLTPLTYLYNNTPTLADVSLYCQLHPSLASADAATHPKRPSLLRYFLQIQGLDAVRSVQKDQPNSFPPLDIDISTLAIPERQVIAPVKKDKKPKAPAAAAGSAPAPASTAAGSVVESVTAAASSAVSSASATVTSAAGALSSAVAAVTGTTPAQADAQPQPKDGKDGKESNAPKEKKEKKEKPAKAAATPVDNTPQPSMIDMRVGKVLDVKRHPDADSLYVESIDVGEAEPRTVCSGLVKYMTEDQIRGATIIVICNLKPVTMRGVKSYAMLLCASHTEGDNRGVEFVLPPEGSAAGERVYFEGFEDATPETQLNPKKKIFETIQPNFTTLPNRDAAWVNPETKTTHLIRTKAGVLKSTSFVGASLS